MKQLYSAGAERYFLSLWNVVDSLMLTFLLASFTMATVLPLRLRSLIKMDRLTLNLSDSGFDFHADLDLDMMPMCYSDLNVDTSHDSCDTPVSLVLFGKIVYLFVKIALQAARKRIERLAY